MTGSELKEARIRLGLTQRQIASRMNIGERTIQDWERKGVPESKEPFVREVLGSTIDGETRPGLPPLTEYSDLALFAELGRRLDEYKAAAKIATDDSGSEPP